MIVLGRFFFALFALLLAVVAGVLFAVVITANGTTWLHVVQVLLLIVCCLWLAWGFNTAVVGIFSRRAGAGRQRPTGGARRAARPFSCRSTTRTPTPFWRASRP